MLRTFDRNHVRARVDSVARLAAVTRTGLLDAPPDAVLARWVDRARAVTGAPLARATLVADGRVWFAARSGGPDADAVPLSQALCPYVVSGGAPLAVADARAHPVLRDHGAVTEQGAVAYAGAPLVAGDEVLGALCVIDDRPRAWTAAELDAIAELAAVVSVELELRIARTQLARERALVHSLTHVHELIAGDAPLPEILDTLVRCFEATDPALVGSVLLLDGETLRHGAAPTLPAAYMAAVDGATIGPDAGTCGAAAWWGHEVVTTDITADAAWAPYRALAAAHGLAHCWSIPIMARDGAVLGTFALYGERPRAPRAEHLLLMRDASRLAGIAVERSRSVEQLRHQATHDALTGLPNRRLVGDRLVQALARARRSGAPVAVAFLDLDRVKLINDAFGHAAGDELIRAAAMRLSAVIRPGDTLGRFGGDEFVAVLEGLSPGALHDTAERLRAAVDAVGTEAGMSVTASVGVALVDGACDPDEALRRADGAMYAAKRAGGDRVVAF